MRLLDRVAAWFGYERIQRQPVNYHKLAAVVNACRPKFGIEYEWFDDEETATRSEVKTPQIIVSADFKRGIPCS